MVTADGKVKLLDFGLADKIRSSMNRISVINQGTSGTAPYMSPEQWRGKQQGAASDQYSLAVTTYEALSGGLPFVGSDIAVLKQAVLDELAEPIKGLDKKVQSVIDKAMSKESGSRYLSCTDFVEALVKAIRFDKRGSHQNKKASGGKSRVIVFALVGVLIVAALSVIFTLLYGDKQEDDVAETAVKNVPLSAEEEALVIAEENAARALAEMERIMEHLPAKRPVADNAEKGDAEKVDNTAAEPIQEQTKGKEPKATESIKKDAVSEELEPTKPIAEEVKPKEPEVVAQPPSTEPTLPTAESKPSIAEPKQTTTEPTLPASESKPSDAERKQTVTESKLPAAESKPSIAEPKQTVTELKQAVVIEGTPTVQGGAGAVVVVAPARTASVDVRGRFDDLIVNYNEICERKISPENGFEKHLKELDKQMRIIVKADSDGDYVAVENALPNAEKEIEWINENDKLRTSFEQARMDAQMAIDSITDYEASDKAAKLYKEAVTAFEDANARFEGVLFKDAMTLIEKSKAGIDNVKTALVIHYKSEIDVAIKAGELQGARELIKALKKYDEAAAEEYSKAIDKIKVAEPIKIVINGVDFEFVPVKAGEFTMGSSGDEAGRGSNETEHKVKISRPFYIGKYEVTRAQWHAVTGDAYDGAYSNYPVVSVSYTTIKNQFISKLNSGAVDTKGMKFRLPTEAEWEYACRAGTDTPYSFGAVLNGDKANCNGKYPYGTQEVGKYLGELTEVGAYGANAWGIFDMHGNAVEWCSDWYGTIRKRDAVDPQGADLGTDRVIRGGAYNLKAKDCRSAYRFRNIPDSVDVGVGFRLILSE